MGKFLLLLLIFPYAGHVVADSWAPPKIKMYYSSDSTFYVRIYPTHVPEKYFSWRSASPKKKSKFQPSDTLVTPCYAGMYKVTDGKDSLLWERKLVNKVAPVAALVSNDGKFLTTFDNWYSPGYGNDVMACYDEKGELIKRHSLEEISPYPISSYRKSVASIQWRCGQEFIDNRRISVCFAGEDNLVRKRIYNLAESAIE